MENPLKKSLSFVTGFFKKSNASVLGIDIGSSAIKLVQLAKKEGRAVLETYGKIELGPYAKLDVGRAVRLGDDKLLEAIADILRESKSTTDKAGIAIPLASSLITVIEVPAVAEEELASIIPIEAKKYIPVPSSEVMLDWLPIPRNKPPQTSHADPSLKDEPQHGETMEVLLVAIHNETLTRFRDLAKNALLESSFFEVETFADIRASVDNDMFPVMVFDLGAASTKINIVENGLVRMSHVINRGSQDITLAVARSLNITEKEAETMKRAIGKDNPAQQDLALRQIINLTLGHIFSETNQVLSNFNIKYNKKVSKIILTGGGSVLRGFETMARDALDAPVVLSNPFAKVVTPAFFEGVLKEVGPSLSVALGVALRFLQEST